MPIKGKRRKIKKELIQLKKKKEKIIDLID